MALSSKAVMQQQSVSRVSAQKSVAVSRPSRRTSGVKTQALLPQVAIGGSTAALLVLPYQRRRTEMEVGPGKLAPKPCYPTQWPQSEPERAKISGETYFDRLQKPVSFLENNKTKDPAGFGIIDVLGWGALGHVIGYALLAGASLQDAGIDAFPR